MLFITHTVSNGNLDLYTLIRIRLSIILPDMSANQDLLINLAIIFNKVPFKFV